MKAVGTAMMGVSALVFAVSALALTGGLFSTGVTLTWVVLLLLSPFVFMLGIPFATGSGPEYLPTDPKLAQAEREKRDAELGLD